MRPPATEPGVDHRRNIAVIVLLCLLLFWIPLGVWLWLML